MKRMITLALLVVLLFISTARTQTIIDVHPTQTGVFDTPTEVKAGQGTWVFEFMLNPASSPDADDAEWLHVDFVNANMDFTFTFSHKADENPHAGAVVSRSDALKFMTLTLSDDTINTKTGKYNLEVGIVLRWKFRTLSVDSSSLNFAIYRGQRYFDFDHVTELDRPTGIVAQSFPRDELAPGTNVVGIFGGETVQVPENDDPRYNTYGTVYNVKAADNSKFYYQLPSRQFLDVELLTPSLDFTQKITRTSTNPVAAQLPSGLNALHYFNLDITSSKQPGPTGLRYGAVLRFRYPYGISSTIDVDTLNFMYYDGTKWAAFSQPSDRSPYTKYVSQSTNEFLEFKKLNMNFALVAKTSGTNPDVSVPVDQSTQTSTPQTSENVDRSSAQEETIDRRDSNSSSSVQFKVMTLLLGLVAVAFWTL